MTELTLKQLQAFVCVAECGSFFEASQRLFVSQPTISSHIAALEGHFGLTLLDRGSRKKVTLTDAGREVYSRARGILQSCDELEQAFSRDGGELRLGASTIPMAYVLPELMAGFQKEHPGCRFVLKKGDSAAVHAMLAEGTIQLGVVGTVLDRENLYYRRLCSDELVFLCRSDEETRALLAQGVQGRALLDRPLIARTPGSGTQMAVDHYLSGIGAAAEKICVIARVESNEAILQMVSQGMGNAILSSRAAHSWQETGKILIFPLEDAPVTRELFLVWPKHIPLSHPARQFAEYARQHAVK